MEIKCPVSHWKESSLKPKSQKPQVSTGYWHQDRVQWRSILKSQAGAMAETTGHPPSWLCVPALHNLLSWKPNHFLVLRFSSRDPSSLHLLLFSPLLVFISLYFRASEVFPLCRWGALLRVKKERQRETKRPPLSLSFHLCRSYFLGLGV